VRFAPSTVAKKGQNLYLIKLLVKVGGSFRTFLSKDTATINGYLKEQISEFYQVISVTLNLFVDNNKRC
jgi:hypothetical protein